MTVAEIAALPKILRLSGYIMRMAALDDCGARLRLAHSHENTDYDEKWTAEEDAEWEAHCDGLDNWWYALSEAEKASMNSVMVYMAHLCRAEDPDEHIKVSHEFLPDGKYAKLKAAREALSCQNDGKLDYMPHENLPPPKKWWQFWR